MDDETFLERVRAQLGTDRRDAVDAVRATLSALGEQLSPQEAADLARQLPGELGDDLRQRAGDNPEALPIEQFYAKVARRQSPQAESDYAREQVRAVFATLSEVAASEELRDAASQLSRDYRTLLGAAR